MAATYDLISSQTVNTSSVAFTDISSGYTDLILQATFTMSAGGDAYVRFNSVSTAIYEFLGAGTQNPSGTQIFEVVNSGGGQQQLPIVGTPNSQQQSNNPNTFELFIPSYSQDSYAKAGMLNASYITDRSAPRNNTKVCAWRWDNSSVINRIDVYTSSANIVGTLNLYGILAANA
jgi:hypothetical protein